MRGCAPVCRRKSINAAAVRMPANAASPAVSTSATNVMTVRLCEVSDETSSTADARDRGDGVADSLHDVGAAPLGKIGNALDETGSRGHAHARPGE